MDFAFVGAAAGVGIGSASQRLAVSNKSSCATSARRDQARMMAAESSGEKQSLAEWLLDRFMHNFGSDYGYETYFKPAEEARDQEVKRVREEVENSKNE